MTISLEISFSSDRCHARVLQHVNGIVSCKTEKIIPYVFENFASLSNVLTPLKWLVEKRMKVVVSIPTHKVLMHDLEVNNDLSHSEILEFLKARSMQLLGYPAADLCFDYEIQEKQSNEKKIIRVVATHRALIENIEKSFSHAKIPLDVINIKSDTNINLLPWREIQYQKKKKNLLSRLIFYALFMAMSVFFLRIFLLHQTQKYKVELFEINKKISNIHCQHAKQHAALLQQLKLISAEKSVSKKTNQIVEILLSNIANELPASMTLKSLNFNEKRIRLTGISNQLSDIHTYNDNLQKNLIWKHIVLSEIQNDQQTKSQLHFTFQVSP